LFLAWDALRAPEGTCAVLNAANEVAVAAVFARAHPLLTASTPSTMQLWAVQLSKPDSLGVLAGAGRQPLVWLRNVRPRLWRFD
jgi:1-deoxy-D-xylulose-5-phosphate reductoisomerase